LAPVAAVMLAVAALDIREVFHQADVDDTRLAALAATVAALHLSAASSPACSVQPIADDSRRSRRS
jgi:hypothetical protein